MKNLQGSRVNTCLVFVFCYLIRFLLRFLLCSLQVFTQLSLLAPLCLCYLGLQAGNDLPRKPPRDSSPFWQDPFSALLQRASSAAKTSVCNLTTPYLEHVQMPSQTRTTFRKRKKINATFGGSVGKKPTSILRTPSFTLQCFSSAADFSCWSSAANCFSSSSTA